MSACSALKMKNDVPIELLPLKQRKVIALAKDVLLQIKLSKLQIKKSHYLLPNCDSKIAYDIYSSDDSAQNHIEDLQQNCSVCALGSMLLSHVSLFNKVSMRRLYNIDRMHIVRILRDYFTPKQLELIENSFEQIVIRSAYTTHEECAIAIKFGLKYTNATERVRAIMQNIVQNKGFFIPKSQKTKITIN